MPEERLTERLRRWARQKTPHQTTTDSSLLLESLRSHLESILSTRQGNVPIDKDYGFSELPELVEDYSVGYKDELKTHLEELILSYEPRIESVQVANINTDSAGQLITCHISGKLKKPFADTMIYFTTVLTSSGRALVKF